MTIRGYLIIKELEETLKELKKGRISDFLSSTFGLGIKPIIRKTDILNKHLENIKQIME